MIIYTIYKAVNIINGKVYIGFDSKWPKRKIEHKSRSKKENNYKFYNAINKYGWDNFEWFIIYQSKDREHTLKVMETFFIKQYDSFNVGYNMTIGGDGTFGNKTWLGRKHKKETIEKISKTKTGKPGTKHTESHKNKMSIVMSGKNNPNYGKKLSEETRKKMSESHKKRNQSVF